MRDEHGFYFADPAGPANAAFQGPAGPQKDADVVIGDYLALPVSERARFMLLLDESEQGYELPTIRELSRHLEGAKADITDRSSYEAVLSSLGAKLAGSRLFEDDESAADGLSVSREAAAQTHPKPVANGDRPRGFIRGARRP